MKPADLRPGHRIAHTVAYMDGSITVDVAFDAGPAGPGRVFVDVEISDVPGGVWACADLPAGTGAEAWIWMKTWPTSRYRLVYLSDTDVAVEES